MRRQAPANEIRPSISEFLARPRFPSQDSRLVHLLNSDHLLDDDVTQRQLRAVLYRFDCPPAHRLGEYALELLIDPERRHIAEHVLGCSECGDELRTLRAFLADDTPLVQPRGWRRVVASLFTPVAHPSAVPVRGDARATSAEYRAAAWHIVLGTLPARDPACVDVDGLVLHDSASSEAVAGRHVALLMGRVAVHTTRTDDLGNFAFDSVAPGTYRLELLYLDEVIVVEDLKLGRPPAT